MFEKQQYVKFCNIPHYNSAIKLTQVHKQTNIPFGYRKGDTKNSCPLLWAISSF